MPRAIPPRPRRTLAHEEAQGRLEHSPRTKMVVYTHGWRAALMAFEVDLPKSLDVGNLLFTLLARRH